MKILVTGASGFIGSHVAEKLLEQHHEVVAFSRQVPTSLIGTSALIRTGDIRNDSDLRRVIQGMDVVIHTAALLAARISSGDIVHKTNAVAAEAIARLSLEHGVKKLVHLSTGGVLGGLKNPPGDETTPYNPEDLYEYTKMIAEQKVLEYSQKGLDAVIVRPTWSYGPRDKRVFKLIRTIQKRFFVKVGKCLNMQHPVYITDLARGIILAMENGKRGDIYFIGGKEHLTTAQLIDIIASRLSVRLFPFSVPVAPMRILAGVIGGIYRRLGKEAPFSESKLSFFLKSRAFSIAKAQKELSYVPEVDFEEGIRRTLRWYKEQRWIL